MRVVDREFDRAQLVPGELVGPGSVAQNRLFVEGFDRHFVELVTPSAREVGEVGLRIAGELDVGTGELMPGAPADRGYDRDDAQGRDERDSPQHLRVAGNRNRSPAQSALTALLPAQSGEEQ